MNIQHLRYAIEVERTGSISQAAENLYMGQPNLSKAIKEMEQTLNITIFKRTSKGAQVTPKGREFLHYARNILAQYAEMEALGRDDASELQSLRLAVPRASYVVDAFTSFMAEVDRSRPLNVDFWETNALQAIQAVAEGRSDVGIIRCKTEYEGYFHSLLAEHRLEHRDLLGFRYLLLMRPDSPLAAQEVVPYEALQPYIEIIHGDTALPQMSLEAVETERGLTPGDKKIHVYERGSQFDLLSRVPDTYMWVSPMPKDLLTRNGLVQKLCDQSPRFKDMMIYTRKYEFGPMGRLFLKELDKTLQEMEPYVGQEGRGQA